MSENETKKEKIEYVDLPYAMFADFVGDRIDRHFRIPERAENLVFGLPVPKDDDEAMRFYGVNLAVLIEKGVKQASYDKDSGIRKLLADKPETESDALALQFENDLPSLPTKREKKSALKAKANEMTRLEKESGMTAAEILAALKSMGKVA